MLSLCNLSLQTYTQADIWSFAICLLELANGHPPHRKSSIKVEFASHKEAPSLPLVSKHFSSQQIFIRFKYM
jgi:serine/threonine protein kinase